MTVKLKLWFMQETAKARLYATTPPRPGVTATVVWLPRSQIEHTSKEPADPGQLPVHVVTIPEWLATSKGLL